ncbi:phosphatase [Gammaproteobacteria bacterium]|jgi:exopolyphosphatase/guanosine-5'-triphosphate,3'-diphosphate pyrophosphatase|nr:phosphatase [Pseudomonadota bacterium]MDA9027471.1 phosphatase [Gammaproteobacteria bacterium]MDA9917000.1 phosphatase [Gammaproteobacteria bacterium]
MKIASIDIGTNAIKSKIFKTTPTSIEFIEGMRSPIRLGGEVFNEGKLSQKKLDQVISTIKSYEGIFQKNKIDRYEIVATSAFRDTSNSEDARRYVETAINHPLRVISGLEEAQLIRFHPKSNTGKNKIFVDLGGGSTEFFLRDSTGIEIRSFQLGAVRNMLSKDKKEEWIRLEKWLETIKPRKKLIGIGGNIRSFLQAHDKKELSIKELNKKIKEFSKLSTQEKIFKYKFSPDRADVIDHALHIFKFISEHLMVETITSTRWGVSDSIGVKLFHEIYSNKINIS